MENKNKKQRNKYGFVKKAVYDGCMSNMSAREISDKNGISMHTVYSTARKLLNMKTRPVHIWKKKEAVF